MTKKKDKNKNEGGSAVIHLRLRPAGDSITFPVNQFKDILINEDTDRLWKLFDKLKAQFEENSTYGLVHDLNWMLEIARWKSRNGTTPIALLQWSGIMQRLSEVDVSEDATIRLKPLQAKLIRDRLRENDDKGNGFQFSELSIASSAFMLELVSDLGMTFEEFEKDKDEYVGTDDVGTSVESGIAEGE